MTLASVCWRWRWWSFEWVRIRPIRKFPRAFNHARCLSNRMARFLNLQNSATESGFIGLAKSRRRPVAERGAVIWRGCWSGSRHVSGRAGPRMATYRDLSLFFGEPCRATPRRRGATALPTHPDHVLPAVGLAWESCLGASSGEEKPPHQHILASTRASQVAVQWLGVMPRLVSKSLSSRAKRYIHCRPSPSPTVNLYSMPACQGRACLDGSSRRPAPTPTRTHKHARTHTHAHPHTRTGARTRPRTRTRTRPSTNTNARTHTHTQANAQHTGTRASTSHRARTRTGTRDDPPRQFVATACVFLDGPESPRSKKTRTVRARPAPQPGGAKRVGRSGAPTSTASSRQRRANLNDGIRRVSTTRVPTARPHSLARPALWPMSGLRSEGGAHHGPLSAATSAQPLGCVSAPAGTRRRRIARAFPLKGYADALRDPQRLGLQPCVLGSCRAPRHVASARSHLGRGTFRAPALSRKPGMPKHTYCEPHGAADGSIHV